MPRLQRLRSKFTRDSTRLNKPYKLIKMEGDALAIWLLHVLAGSGLTSTLPCPLTPNIPKRLIRTSMFRTAARVWNVGEFKPDTVGFLVTPKTTYRYISKSVCRAIRQNTCYMLDGVPQWPRYSTDIYCLSCADTTAKEVYLAGFKLAGKMPT